MWLYAFSKDEGHLCRFKESEWIVKDSTMQETCLETYRSGELIIQ